MDDLKKEIGKRIKQCRKEKGMTQKELARKVGCHEITIRQYESGRRSPKLVSQYAIARALSVTYESLFVLSAPCAALGTNLAELGTDCISRQAAIDAVQNRHMMLSKEKTLLINDLEKLPPAEPQRIKGEWALQSDDYHEYYECDQCGIAVGIDDIRNFCPNCGADMRGEQDDSV